MLVADEKVDHFIRWRYSSYSQLVLGSQSFGLDETVAFKAQNTFFWSKEHKLGISMEYLLPLYRAAKNRFMNAYASYKMHSSHVFPETENELVKHSTALSLLSSDFGTAWNARKLVISRRDDFSILAELHISTLVLSFAPKSENAWSYRRWVIKRIAGKSVIPSLEDILENESKTGENSRGAAGAEHQPKLGYNACS